MLVFKFKFFLGEERVPVEGFVLTKNFSEILIILCPSNLSHPTSLPPDCNKVSECDVLVRPPLPPCTAGPSANKERG